MWQALLLTLLLVQRSFQEPGSPLEPRRDEETENVDEIDSLYTLQWHIDRRLDDLTQLVRNGFQEASDSQVSQTEQEPFIPQTGPVFEEIIEEMNNRFSAIEDEIQKTNGMIISMSIDILKGFESRLQNVATKQDLVEIESKTSTLATSVALDELRQNISDLASSSTDGVMRTISTLATKSDIDNFNVHTTSRFEEIQLKLDSEAFCNNRNDFDQVLQSLSNVESNVNSVANNMDTCMTEVKNTCEQEEKSTHVLEQLFQVINDSLVPETTPAPPTTTTTTTTTTAPPRSVSPCINSHFVGGGVNLDICEAAVRFKKCQLEFVAYHCCRSCTDAGMVPVMGPHRYLNHPRNVSILKALQFMRP